MEKVNFIVSYNTDKGIRKLTNQDALLMKVSNTPNGRVGLFVVCDGMGGLEQGELASATVIRGLDKWYEDEFEELLKIGAEEARKSLVEKIFELNSLLLNYSLKNNLKLGTTLTAMLIIYDNVIIFQVGDSRVYKFKDNIEVLTKDQTFVAREVERGNITLEEAKRHPRRNVLLQCIGASPDMQPVITESILEKDTVYMLCSDGMYHELTDDEFYEFFNPVVNINEKVMNENCKAAVELVKNRMEKDNISVILIRTS